MTAEKYFLSIFFELCVIVNGEEKSTAKKESSTQRVAVSLEAWKTHTRRKRERSHRPDASDCAKGQRFKYSPLFSSHYAFFFFLNFLPLEKTLAPFGDKLSSKMNKPNINDINYVYHEKLVWLRLECEASFLF